MARLQQNIEEMKSTSGQDTEEEKVHVQLESNTAYLLDIKQQLMKTE